MVGICGSRYLSVLLLTLCSVHVQCATSEENAESVLEQPTNPSPGSEGSCAAAGMQLMKDQVSVSDVLLAWVRFRLASNNTEIRSFLVEEKERVAKAFLGMLDFFFISMEQGLTSKEGFVELLEDFWKKQKSVPLIISKHMTEYTSSVISEDSIREMTVRLLQKLKAKSLDDVSAELPRFRLSIRKSFEQKKEDVAEIMKGLDALKNRKGQRILGLSLTLVGKNGSDYTFSLCEMVYSILLMDILRCYGFTKLCLVYRPDEQDNNSVRLSVSYCDNITKNRANWLQFVTMSEFGEGSLSRLNDIFWLLPVDKIELFVSSIERKVLEKVKALETKHGVILTLETRNVIEKINGEYVVDEIMVPQFFRDNVKSMYFSFEDNLHILEKPKKLVKPVSYRDVIEFLETFRQGTDKDTGEKSAASSYKNLKKVLIKIPKERVAEVLAELEPVIKEFHSKCFVPCGAKEYEDILVTLALLKDYLRMSGLKVFVDKYNLSISFYPRGNQGISFAAYECSMSKEVVDILLHTPANKVFLNDVEPSEDIMQFLESKNAKKPLFSNLTKSNPLEIHIKCRKRLPFGRTKEELEKARLIKLEWEEFVRRFRENDYGLEEGTVRVFYNRRKIEQSSVNSKDEISGLRS